MSSGTGTDDGSPFFGSIAVTLDPALRVESPIAAMALAEWDRLRRGRAMPAPADVDPLEMPRELLAHLLLVDIEYQPVFRYRWRLIGTHITKMVNRDRTGRYWDEIYDDRTFAMIASGPRWVLDNRRPVRVLSTAYYAGKHHVRAESVDMPLSADGVAIQRLLTVTVYDLD